VRIEKLAQTFDIDVKYVHFPLHPDTPMAGRTLQAMFGRSAEEVAARNAHMKGLMDAEGLPYGERTHTYNSRLAQELGTWAETQPGGTAIHDVIYKAYFVDRRNVGDIDVLVELAASVGLDRAEARAVLTERRCKAAVDADWAKSHQYGVTGVPTFVAARMGVVGAQPYEVLEELLDKAGARRRD
jgi:predicted DsbA family dithiol-disulfide isomerase